MISLEIYKVGELRKRISRAYKILEECKLCPRNCKVNRLNDQKGFCKTGLLPIISSYGPHFGEESPLVGYYGSGTIFVSSCNLRCIFCQNFDISHLMDGQETLIERFGEMMLELQSIRCHNINIVTPTHIVPQFLSALQIAIEKGLKLPIVYNTGGYDSLETIKLLDGIIDIYMPDIKTLSKKVAKELLNAEDYPEVVKECLKEMQRQVGDLKINNRGIAERGLLIRHLVIPDDLSTTEEVMKFISQEISKDAYVNIMAQYRPCGLAYKNRQINRRITTKEYQNAIEIAHKYGIYKLD